MNRWICEFIGTFVLVFAGTGAIAADAITGGAVTHVGVAIAFGLAVGSMIYAVGDVSGAHLNPAVTLGFWLARRMPGGEALAYVGSQCAGALAGSAALWLLLSGPPTLGATTPTVPLAAAFGLEVAQTFLLAFVIIEITSHEKPTPLAGAAIGGTVALCALFGGPFTGASMNPARSLGPAVVSGELAHLWLYWTAPFLGGALAVGGCRLTRGGDCCVAPATPTPAEG